MKTKIKLIAADLDGTLLLPDKTISKANREVLSRVSEMGILIVPATGRPHSGMKKIFEWLPFVQYAILSNGAIVQDVTTGNVIAKHTMQPEEVLEFYDYAQSQNLIVDFFHQGKRFVAPDWNENVAQMDVSEGTKKMLLSNCVILENPREYLKTTQDIEKISVRFLNAEQKEQFYEQFQQKFVHLKITTSLAVNIEATAKGVTKAVGLKELADYLGLQMDEIMVFGDQGNDREMIQAAGIGVAMGNAEDAVKQIADRITKCNTEDGVAYMIQEVLGWKQELQ